VCGARLNRRGSAISVAAQAEDLHLASDALAVIAAELLLFRGNAGTGHVCAFLGMKHHSPPPARSPPFYSGHTAGRLDRRKDSSSNLYARTSKIAQSKFRQFSGQTRTESGLFSRIPENSSALPLI
jgi:hypothetical protein